ncbi:MAG: hypothetical protein AB7E80_16020 [Hyphomicrobiaceae bacterium]
MIDLLHASVFPPGTSIVYGVCESKSASGLRTGPKTSARQNPNGTGTASWNALRGPTLVRYLGIEVDDAIVIAKKIDI